MKYKIPMTFKDGDGGRRMRKEFKGKSTIDLVIEGHRIATSRDMSKLYNKYDIKIGDVIQFYSDEKTVNVRVTKELYPITSISREEWSKMECLDLSGYNRLNRHYYQFQFELI